MTLVRGSSCQYSSSRRSSGSSLTRSKCKHCTSDELNQLTSFPGATSATVAVNSSASGVAYLREARSK